MGIRVINRKYTELYSDDVINWLLGNVGDIQEVIFDIEADISFIGSTTNPLQIDYITNSFVNLNGTSWGSLGFDDGMTIEFLYDLMQDTNSDGEYDLVSTINNEYTVQTIQNDKMFVKEVIQGDDIEMMPINYGSKKIANVIIRATNAIQGAEITYGHISNDDYDDETLNSVIDGSLTSFSLPNINAVVSGSYQFMETKGVQSGMSIISCKFRKTDGFAEDSGTLIIWETVNSTFRLRPQYGGPGLDDDRDAVTIPLRLNRTAENYQQVSEANQLPINLYGDIIGAESKNCLIYNASSAYSQDLLLDFDFKVSNVFEFSDIDNFSIILVRYSNGSNLVFAEKIYLQTWADARSYLGKNISFYKVKNIDVNENDSWALAFEYEHNGGDAYYADIEMTAKGSVKASNKNTRFAPEGKQYFQCAIKFIISSFFENIDNIDNVTQPSFLVGDGSLTDNIDIRLYPVWNNPNVLIKNDLQETKKIGNTGWFNENFNELDSDFKVDSVIYRDKDGNVVDSLDYVNETTVEVEISGIQNVSSNSKFGFGFMYVPKDESDYKDLNTPFYLNTFMSNGSIDNPYTTSDTEDLTEYDGAGINRGHIGVKNIRFFRKNDKAVMRCSFYPNAEFSNIFENKNDDDRRYIIWVSVSDVNSRERNFSNRVSLLADVDDLIKSIPSAGAYPMTTRFVEHPFSENQEGVDVYSGVVQDDLLVRSRFKIDNTQNIEFQGITFAVELENTETGEILNLESYNVDLSNSSKDPNGFQLFEINETRGFKLDSENNKNYVKVIVDDVNSKSNSKAYIAYYGFKIRYEDWIIKENVPDDFFNAFKENNGNNNDWYDYINTSESKWRIKFTNYMQALLDGDIVKYRTPYDFEFKDYNQNSLVATDIRYIRNSDNSIINIGSDPDTGKPLGIILSNEPTRIEIDFTIQDTGIWVLGNTYSVTTVEIDKGGGIFESRQISSVWLPEDDNPLKPLNGEVNLKITISGDGKVATSSCLVDPNDLDDAVRYRITGRIGCFEDEDIIDDGGIYEAAYEAAYE